MTPERVDPFALRLDHGLLAEEQFVEILEGYRTGKPGNEQVREHEREDYCEYRVVTRSRACGRFVEKGALHCHTILWIVMLSFPVFVVSFVFADPPTALIFSQRNAGSGEILAIVSMGHFRNAASGLCVPTLQVPGQIRTLVAIVTVVSFSLNLNRHLLDIPGTFPRLMRFESLQWFFTRTATTADRAAEESV